MERPSVDDYFGDWKAREALAQEMLPIMGKLENERGVQMFLYGRTLNNRSVANIMMSHRRVREVARNELSEFESSQVLKSLAKLDLSPAQIDLGKLTVKYMEALEEDAKVDLDKLLANELSHLVGVDYKPIDKPTDIILYGFGRIGRLVTRLLIEQTGNGKLMRLRAIVVRKGGDGDLEKRVNLLRTDSVHGTFSGTVRVEAENNRIIANGNVIEIIYAESPDSIDYTQYGINDALVIDNTGIWRDEESLGQHLKSKGVSKVMLTAPGKGNLKNIVMGINHDTIEPEDRIISAASCTTNAIAPVLKLIHDKYGIVHGHVETIHAYTNDQNLIDNFHKADRRGRSAPLNMVLTETGAAKAVSKAVPELEGKLTGNAVRVPVANVSVAILNLTLLTGSSSDEINEYLREIAVHSPLQNQIGYTESPDAVSTDFIGSREACTVDATATKVNGKNMILYLWYDNEFGYSAQVVRMVNMMAGVNFLSYPEEDSMAH
ncbi:MAG: glyceraldehyde-3-phosphate dehydrogenase [Gammaproteobacteria bacterium]|nr:glyceraldehyde-3-phosphate dehydrogenase [Gammaproteobacteria bacterium]